MSERAIKRRHERELERGRRRARRKARLGAGLIAGAALLAAPAAASAAPITVTALDDPVPDGCGVGTCTLREAITQASGSAGPDSIVFQAGLSGDLTLVQGELDINDPAPVSITGPAPPADSIVIDGDDSFRGFLVTGATTDATIASLEITHGAPTTGPPIGAGILIYGGGPSLELDNVTIDRNARGSGKYIGGGVGAVGVNTLTINDSTISGNSGALGAGLFAKYGPQVTADNTLIKQNGGAATFAGGGATVGKYSQFNGTGLVIRGNSSGYFGGGLSVGGSTDATLSDSTISGNNAATLGGGVGYIGSLSNPPGSLSVTDSTLSGNYAPRGGGAVVAGSRPASTVTFSGDTLNANTATYAGPDPHRIFGAGGAFNIFGEVYGAVTIENSTMTGNYADAGAGLAIGAPQGPAPASPRFKQFGEQAGIPNEDRVLSGPGSAEVLKAGGSFAFDSLTIAGNTATEAGGGVYVGASYDSGTSTYYSETISFDNTIVAGNMVNATANDLSAVDLPGAGVQLSYSLIQNKGNAPVTQVPAGKSILGVDPQLSALAANGGPTKTMLPAGTSPAIDTGSTALAVDQRGIARPQAAAKDIGAVELRVAAASITSGPSGTIKNTKPSFGFSSPTGSGFECSIDGGAYFSCANPFKTPALEDGPHTFAVRAQGAEGFGPPAQRSFTVDTTVKGAKIKATKTQKQKGGKVLVKVKAGAGEQVSGVGTGKIGKFKLKKVSKTTGAGKKSTYKLKPKSSKDAAKILDQLSAGKKLKAKVTVKLTDDAGNSKTLKAKVKLKKA